VLVATAAWVAWHPIALPEPRGLRSQDDDWHLPNHSKSDSAALVATIEHDKLWGASAANALPGGPLVSEEEKPLTAPDWRIAGVVTDGKENYAMVMVDGQPIQQLKVGDKLPGGFKIVSMTADRVCILLNGKRRVLRTYKE